MADATQCLGNKKIATFGHETMSPEVPGISNMEVHHTKVNLDLIL